MKPNYCSGGSFVSSGGFTNFTNNNIFKKNHKLTPFQDEHAKGDSTTAKISTPITSEYYSSSGVTSSHTSPFIVYRSAKYVTPHARAWQNFRNYAKYYVVGPTVLFANRCKDAFYLLCGFSLLILTSPLWILMFLGLFIVRRLRFFVIGKLYPELDQLNECNSYSPTSADSPGIVNSIIWIRGRVDANTIKQKFKATFNENLDLQHLLSRRIGSRLGVRIWECCEDFNLDEHILENSRQIVDEPLKELYRTGSGTNKSILQKYVSHYVSIPMEESHPPWKIHVISYISREDGLREKTCLVIRMHVSLIRNPEVQKALKELFLTPSEKQALVNPGKDLEKTIELDNAHEELKVPFVLLSQMKNLERLFLQVKKFWRTQQNSFTIWINLRVKQLEFHSKTAVLSLVLIDIKDSIKYFLSLCELLLRMVFNAIILQVGRILVNLQALAVIPMIVLVSFMRRDRLKKLGLQKGQSPEKRLISWSDLLYVDLVQEICERSGGLSPENVVMMACSYALSDYYQMNNMPIPQKIGFTVNHAYNSICSSKIRKAIHLPGNERKTQYSSLLTLRGLEEKTRNYPEWKMLGLLYASRYLICILPSFISFKIQKSITSCYPFSFTHVNLSSDSVLNCGGQDFLPIRQLYGEIVEDFAFWPFPPLSDLGVSISLSHYTGKMRLFVMSPFQSMDTVLTHRCNQYLIRMAEDVGIDRSRIPYSRRTSPSSTSCPSPQPFSMINVVDNLSLLTSKRPSSLNNTCL